MSVAQIGTLTPLRGVAAMMVVVFHVHNRLPNLELPPFVLRGYLWVDFFFLLSGFVLMHVYRQRFDHGVTAIAYRRYLWARVSRIYPLHVTVLFGFVVFEAALILISRYGVADFAYQGFQSPRSPGQLLTNLLLIQSWHLHDSLSWNYPAWSISTEMFAYLVFPLLVVALRRFNTMALTLGAALLAALLVALSRWNGGNLSLHYDWGLVRCLLEFTGGMMLYRVYLAGTVAHLMGRDLMFLLCALMTLAVLQRSPDDAAVVLAFALVILAGAHNTGRVRAWSARRPLAFLGDISYSIYLVHMLVIHGVTMIAFIVTGRRFASTFTPAQSWLTLIGFCLLIVALSAATYRYVERPAMAALRGRGVTARPYSTNG